MERIGLGLKEVGGRLTRRYCVKIYVTSKAEPEHPAHRLPIKTRVLLPVGRGMFRTRWVPTDVVTAGTVVLATTATTIFNPIRGGVEVGRAGGAGLGTLACLVKDANGAIFGLTAGHVVSSSIGPVAPGAAMNQPLNAPPRSRPGSAYLGQTIGGSVGGQPFVDWALIQLTRQVDGNFAWDESFQFTTSVMSEDRIINEAPAVAKLSAVSGLTSGGLSAKLDDLQLKSGLVIKGIFEMKSDSADVIGKLGDSGALVIGKGKHEGIVIGLLFAVQDPPVDPGGRAYVFPLARLPQLTIA